MNNFNKYRGSILKQNGEFINYDMKAGFMHREIIEDYAEHNNIEYPSEEAITYNGDIYFRNADNGTFIVYMPSVLSDEQLYQLELNEEFFDSLNYLGVLACDQEYEFDSNIWDNFSSSVLQSYYKSR